MGFELDRLVHGAEDFLRRNIRSRSAREAQQRRLQRKLREFGRRLRRSGLILAGLLALLIACSILVTPIGFLTWLVAIPTLLLIAALSLFWPSRLAAATAQAARSEAARPQGAPEMPLDALAARVEDGLIDRCKELPGQALPAADAVISRLNELQPHLAELDQNSMLAGDARRLLGQHLPRLVDAYLGLPSRARTPGSEASRRFAENLGTVGEELEHLLDQCCRDRHHSFETQSRFIETRYSEDRNLKGE